MQMSTRIETKNALALQTKIKCYIRMFWMIDISPSSNKILDARTKSNPAVPTPKDLKRFIEYWINTILQMRDRDTFLQFKSRTQSLTKIFAVRNICNSQETRYSKEGRDAIASPSNPVPWLKQFAYILQIAMLSSTNFGLSSYRTCWFKYLYHWTNQLQIHLW